jgi:hypothetical protein
MLVAIQFEIELQRLLRLLQERLTKDTVAFVKSSTIVTVTVGQVIDMSGSGVCLRAYLFEIPDEFDLMLAGDGPAQDGTLPGNVAVRL